MRDGGQLMISKATAIIMQRREKGWGKKWIYSRRDTQSAERKQNKRRRQKTINTFQRI